MLKIIIAFPGKVPNDFEHNNNNMLLFNNNKNTKQRNWQS